MDENERRRLHEQVLQEFNAMGFQRDKAENLRLIEQALANTLCHIGYEGTSFVIKIYYKPANEVEMKCYDILKELNVPTLKIFGRSQKAILMEDLDISSELRIGEEKDMIRPEVGRSVAEWYLRLHEGCKKYFKSNFGPPTFLKRDADELSGPGIMETGKRLGLEGLSVWKLAADNVEGLKQAVKARAETIIHNDFHWSNFAVSRIDGPECSVIVFDYHLPRVGMAYSDCRKIDGVLREPATSAFWERYGPPDEIETILDGPVWMLYALFDLSPFPRARFPKYGKEVLEEAECGELERSIRRALEVI